MDCSKTIDFFAEFNRLCNSRTACEADAANKEQCPLLNLCGLPLLQICAEKAIENLQKWSDEHPKKTYAQDFLKNSQKRRATQTEPHLYAEKESTAEYARHLRTAITQELAIDVGASL